MHHVDLVLVVDLAAVFVVLVVVVAVVVFLDDIVVLRQTAFEFDVHGMREIHCTAS